MPVRCLPSGSAPYPYWADAACTKAIVVVTPGVTVPTYVASPAPLAAGTATRLSPVGAKLAVATWYFKAGATCISAGAVPGGYDLYDANGAEIPPSAFVEFTVVTQTL